MGQGNLTATLKDGMGMEKRSLAPRREVRSVRAKIRDKRDGT
jgi:hypothetical protein